MANETQNGDAILWGIPDSGEPISIEGYGSFLLESAKAGHKFDSEHVKDTKGFTANITAVDGRVEMELTWCPSGTTVDAAIATAKFPAPLAKVTLANFALDWINGDWIYIGDAMIDLTQKQGKMQLKIRKYDDEDQNTNLTKNVTSL